MKKFTVDAFKNSKRSGRRISVLTAYDYSTAKLLDEAGVDALLVGDSLGMVMLGYESTLSVTMEDMLHHCKAVTRGTKKAFVIADMPFMSYQASVEEAVRNAGRLVQQGGAHGVKLEGGKDMEDRVKAIVKAQIPVMGHLGLTPQSINLFGGYKIQGKTEDSAKKMIEDAVCLQDAGAFSIVLECVPVKLAEVITKVLDIPTIGIGAGKYCDGQVLVVNDMLGTFNDVKTKFVKRYENIGESIKRAASNYIRDVEDMNFPGKEHGFIMEEKTAAVLENLYGGNEDGK